MSEILMDEQLFDRIQGLCEKGEKLSEKDKFGDAIRHYHDALKLVPEPVNTWEVSTWIFTAIAENYYYQDNYKEAAEYYQSAMTCPNGKGNPFLELRLGQCQYEMGDMVKAEENLLAAFHKEGEAIYEGEPDAYLDFIRTRIQQEKGDIQADA